MIPGDAIALLRIPAFGPDYEVPILSGTDLSFLDRGVGHYTTTALPGRSATSPSPATGSRTDNPSPGCSSWTRGRGHRGDPRRDLHVRDGRLARNLTVNDTETWVLDPDPRQRDAEATEALLTLTTCQDLFHSPDRSVGFAHLAKTVEKP